MVVITLLNIIVVFMAYLAKDEKHGYLLAWAFVLLSCVLGIRYGYGNDYYEYQYFFYNEDMMEGNSEHMEQGWLFLNRLFRPFGFTTFVFFLTSIEHLMLYDLIRRYVSPQYYWLALFIYLFNPYFMLIGLSMMRQFFVQMLGFYALEFVYKRKFIQFAVLIMVCISIHKIGLLLIPLAFFPLVSKISYGKGTMFFFLVIGVLSFFFLITRIDSIIESLGEIFVESDMRYGDSYLNANVLREEQRLSPKMLLRYAIYILLLVRNYNYLSDSDAGRYFSIVVTFGALFIPFAAISPMAMRVSWIYSMVVIIALPILLQKEKLLIIRIIVVLVFVLILFREFENHFISEIYGKYYMNYHTIFSDYMIK